MHWVIHTEGEEYMRVLLVHNQYRSNQVGGEEVVFYTERQALQEMLGAGKVWSYVVSNDNLNRWSLLKTIWGSKAHANAIQALVEEHEIDIVHVHNFFPLLTPSIFKAAKEAGAVVIQTLHNYRWWCLPGTLYQDKKGPCRRCSTKKWFWPAILGRCYNKSLSESLMGALALTWYRWQGVQRFIDQYWALSHTQIDTLKQLGVSARQIAYKPNFMEPLAIEVTVEEKQGYLFVGRLEEAKGIVLLLDTWQKLGWKESLTIIGAGPLLETLRNQYQSDTVRFLGACAHFETLKKMAEARYVFQLSMMEETFGLTMIEAMQSGTPVIGLEVGTRAEMIEHGFNGWLATPETLGAVILKSEACAELWYRQLSANAKKRAEVFEKNRMMQHHIDLYEKALRVY